MYRQFEGSMVEARRSPRWWRALSVIVVALVFGMLMRATLLLAAPAAVPASVGAEQFTPFSDDDDDDDDDDLITHYGLLVERPDEKVGTWVISITAEVTLTYTAEDATLLEGDPAVGECVEVKALESTPTIAFKIEAKDDSKCNDDDGDDGDDDGDDDDDDIKRYGVITERPEEKVGTWVIGGIAYTATEQTELEEEYGALEVGTCAEVEVRSSDPTVAKEIESESDYKCAERDDDDSARAVLFGVIEELPPVLQDGIWKIGGKSFVVSPTTELIDNGATFTEGVTVKVHFRTDLDETNYALRIAIKFGHNNPCRERDDDDHGGRHGNDDGDDDDGDDDDGDDDDGDDNGLSANHNGDDDDDDDDDKRGRRYFGYCPGQEGRAVGLVDSRPEGEMIGTWIVGGIEYSTTASTDFRTVNDILAGERVKVEYVVLDDDTRLATKIAELGGGNLHYSILVGYVMTKPVGFVGEWVINGAPFVALPNTVFVERGTLFAVGSYVVVEYEIVNEQREIRRILTYVPPGAGDDDNVGKLEAIGGAAAAGEAAPQQSNEVWTVGGVDYLVGEATLLVDNGRAFAEGDTVYVNSYTENGQRYATMIRTQSGQLYIPQAWR